MDSDVKSIIPSIKKLFTLLSLGAILLQTGCSEEKTAAFKTRDAADKACYDFLRNEIEKEISGTSDIRKDNHTYIKNNDEQYVIFDYGCKPEFSEGDEVGTLIPIYFYLDKFGDVDYNIAWNWDGDDYVKYTYPLNKRVDFSSKGWPGDKSKMSGFIEPFEMPFKSIKSDAFISGIGWGSVFRLCRSTYLERDITEQQADILFEKDKKYVTRWLNNEDGYVLPWGPASDKAKELALAVMDGRWEKCKEEGYDGWNKKN